MTVPEVAVVVPTVDRVQLLARCLRGLAGQRLDGVEVVVVHDGDRGVVALLDDWSARLPLCALQVADRGASAKRNAGWRTTAARLVAFTDDDCEAAPGWLDSLRRAADDGADLVAGPVVPHPDDSGVTGTWARTVTADEPGLYPGCNLLATRAALERSGGFDPTLAGGEDTDLAWRIVESGGRPGWAPDARVWHAVRQVTFTGHLRSLPRWGSLPLVVRRHPHLRRLAHRRFFWKDSHPAACLALAGLAGAVLDRKALVATVPLVRRRVREAGFAAGVQLAAADVVEAAVLVAGSVRHRTVLL